jgi:hypothetical protein
VHKINKKLLLLVFCCFYLINILVSAGHTDLWDGVEAFLVTESMALKHTAKLDPTVPSVQKLHFNVNYTVAYYETTFEGRPFNVQHPYLKPVYTVRSLLISAIGLPFYYLALALSLSPLITIAMFVNSLLIALTSLVIFAFAIDLYGSAKTAFILALIFNVCSFVLPYTSTYWTQPSHALTVIASIFFLYKSVHHSPLFICNYIGEHKVRHKRIKNNVITAASKTNTTSSSSSSSTANSNYYHDPLFAKQKIENKSPFYAGLAGLLIGLSVIAHPTSLIFLPGFLIYSLVESRKNSIKCLISFVIVLSIVLLCIAALNYIRFHSFMDFGYGHYGTIGAHDGWRGLIGLLVSPGASLFVFFPISVLLPWAAIKMKNQNKKYLMYLFVFILVINWLDVGTLPSSGEPFSWWGGQSWGPRYFVVVLPIITLMIGSLLIGIDRKKVLKYSIIALSISGFYVNMIGTLVWTPYEQIYLAVKQKVPPDRLWNLLVWHPFYSPIVVNSKFLFENFAAHIPVQRYNNTSWHWTTYGLAPCSYDNYIYCKFGLAYNIASVIAIALVVLYIMVEVDILNPRVVARYAKRVNFIQVNIKLKRR